MTTELALRCPECGQNTESLKAYRLPTFLLFLGIGASFKHGLVVACPPCMRRKLGKLTLVNILPANLLWILLLLPWYGIAALRSLTKGHSREASGVAGAPAPSYRDPGRAVAAPSGKPWHDDPQLRGYFQPGRPDDIDATFVFAQPGGGKHERLPVRLLQSEGELYRATVLQSSAHDPSLQRDLEVFVRPSHTHPPLVCVPPGAAQNLTDWSSQCGSCQFDLVFTPMIEIARAQSPYIQPGQEPSPLTSTCPACGGLITSTRISVAVTDAPAGLGPLAERAWKIATFVTFVSALMFVGGAGYTSESAGVAAAYGSAFFVGFPLGGWRSVGWARRTRRGAWVPPLVGLATGILFLFLAVFFFEGIFPSL